MASKMEMLGARTVSTGCLEPGCDTHWEWHFVMKYLPHAAVGDYSHGMLNVWKETVQILTCPSEACAAIGLLDPMAPGFPQVECADCKARICAACKIPWHVGVSCADYNATLINEKITTPEKETLHLMQATDGKRCPNCYLVIEKDGGCNSMYCPGCRTYFNWGMAASAIPGTKPALSQQELYVHTPVACEVDAIRNGVGPFGIGDAVNAVDITMTWTEVWPQRAQPLPDPDDDL